MQQITILFALFSGAFACRSAPENIELPTSAEDFFNQHNASQLTEIASKNLEEQRSPGCGTKTDLQKVETTHCWTLSGLFSLDKTLIEELSSDHFEAYAVKKSNEGKVSVLVYRMKMVCKPLYDAEGHIESLLFQLVVPENEGLKNWGRYPEEHFARPDGTFTFSTATPDVDFEPFKISSLKQAELRSFKVTKFPDQLTVSVNTTIIVQHLYQ